MICKNGLVMNIEKNSAYIMTSNGEFLKIKIDKRKPFPVIGSEYSGEVFKSSSTRISKFRYAIAACLLFFMLSLGGGAYAYYTPISTVTISINPSIEFKLNRWNRVLSSHGLNSDGEKLLKELKTQNKPIDAALVMVINQAKTDKYINENYTNTDKAIVISIVGKDVNLPKVKDQLSKDNINVKIDSNGSIPLNKQNSEPNKALPKNDYKQNDTINKDTNSNKNNLNINKNSNLPKNDNISKPPNNDKVIDNNSKSEKSNTTNDNPDTNFKNNDNKNSDHDKNEKSNDKSDKGNKADKNNNHDKNNKNDKDK